MKKRYPAYETCDLMHDGVCVSTPCVCRGMAKGDGLSETEKSKELKLGQKIVVETKLRRRSKYIEEGKYKIKKEIKFWDEIKLKQPIEGIVVGVRNLSNGENEWISEYGNQYNPKEYFSAIIVAYRLSRKPLLVKNEL